MDTHFSSPLRNRGTSPGVGTSSTHMKPILSGGNSPEDLRPRLSVVLPLVAVCFLTIGFLLNDVLRPQPETPMPPSPREDPLESAGSRRKPTQPPGKPSSPFRSQMPLPTADFLEETPLPNDTNETVEAIPIQPPLVLPAPKTGQIQHATPLLIHAKTGTLIRGRVTLRGNPPPEREIPHDPTCKVRGKLMTRLYRKDPATSGLADVLVYIKEGMESRTYETPRTAATLMVAGCKFEPYVLSIQTGQSLRVGRFDLVPCTVHFTPSVPGNREATVPLLRSIGTTSVVFDQPELFLPVRCDSHPWMFAYVGVFRHPFHAVTGKDGSFQIPYVPTGTYTLEAVHRKAGQVSREISVIGIGEATLDFGLDVPPAGI